MSFIVIELLLNCYRETALRWYRTLDPAAVQLDVLQIAPH